MTTPLRFRSGSFQPQCGGNFARDLLRIFAMSIDRQVGAAIKGQALLIKSAERGFVSSQRTGILPARIGGGPTSLHKQFQFEFQEYDVRAARAQHIGICRLYKRSAAQRDDRWHSCSSKDSL